MSGMSSRTPLFFCEVCTVRKGSVTGRRFQRSECSSLRARKQVTLRQLKTLVIEFENSGGEEETVSRAITRDGITPFIFRMNRSEHQAGSGGTCRKVCRTNNCDYPIVSWVKQGHCFKISRLYCNEASSASSDLPATYSSVCALISFLVLSSIRCEICF